MQLCHSNITTFSQLDDKNKKSIKRDFQYFPPVVFTCKKRTDNHSKILHSTVYFFTIIQISKRKEIPLMKRSSTFRRYFSFPYKRSILRLVFPSYVFVPKRGSNKNPKSLRNLNFTLQTYRSTFTFPSRQTQFITISPLYL